jgi:hypothetical protein
MEVYGNKIDNRDWRACEANRDRYIRKFGYDPDKRFSLGAEDDPWVGRDLKLKRLVEGGGTPMAGKPIVIGTIRMGYGHMRMGLAAASAARAMGYSPYWLDFMSFKDSTASKVIQYLNKWYSIASRISQKWKLFNDLVWEKATSEWARPITYYARNKALTELFMNIPASLPPDTPFIASHPWCAQAAAHAGMTNIVNMIPDNWPLSFHLAEGAVLAVQSASCFIGYRELRNMGPKRETLKPIPEGQVRYTGHYIDHEIVSNIPADCDRRLKRMAAGKPRRILMTIGGAGAQQGIFEGIIRYLMPLVRENRVVLLVNMGDHRAICEDLIADLGFAEGRDFRMHRDWDESRSFASSLLKAETEGCHVFLYDDPMPAIYTTNLLMRAADVMMTKPSELAYYPVPKLFVQRVGRFEAWGAIRGAEIGDGTIETDTLEMLKETLNVLIEDDDLLSLYCENIKRNHTIGIYDGAYNLVRILEEKMGGRKAAPRR